MSEKLEKIINQILLNPSNKDVLAIFKSMRNGVHYGTKIRFAHSLVMSLLYKRNITLVQRISSILNITRSHGVVLASFAFVYKLSLLLLKWYNSVLETSTPNLNEFLAGALGGFLVYGKLVFKEQFNSSITDQITLYCGARVTLAVGKLIAFMIAKKLGESNNWDLKQKKKFRDDLQSYAWCFSASFIWGSVLFFHRFYPKFLQHGLESSMSFIYDDLDWTDWRSFLGI
ncbi:hypothetical protein WICPIJ_005627 [Wickerhamomyces pijperi]|uniref:Peroxisomal membrane protein 4 n=1 Tax=Wickerhamomyces pijperi TaxID=599730 RepID=A0A9P8Q3L3_WICPI|nr:hypothetical protein WICPIJ_005627 [Wickerhamomyces pijperi]